jgi:uncharacterized membrane protein
MRSKTFLITQAAIIAAAYVVLTLPFAQFAFGPIQFRLAEALTVLPVLTPAAIPGLFLGCLLANLLNPSPLGLIDIIFGSLATLLAAYLTWRLGRSIRENNHKMLSWTTFLAMLPPIVINGLVVGFYLPFILPDIEPSAVIILLTMLSVALSEAVVVYLIGGPLLFGLRQAKLTLYRKE